MDYQFELVGKIGSMALIRKEDQDIDYNIFARLGRELKPGMIWVTSGATEIGRLDYINRTGKELTGDPEQDKTDYAAQGQAILMQNYRQFIAPEYGVRQLLVEHTHFNDPEKREHIRKLLIRAAKQGTIPIVNYNDPVSDEENRKVELAPARRSGDVVHECVDNDETAAVIAGLVHARMLVLRPPPRGFIRTPPIPPPWCGMSPAKPSRKWRRRSTCSSRAVLAPAAPGPTAPGPSWPMPWNPCVTALR